MLEQVSNILLGAGIASILIFFVQNKIEQILANKRLLYVGVLFILLSLLTGFNDFMLVFRDSMLVK